MSFIFLEWIVVESEREHRFVSCPSAAVMWPDSDTSRRTRADLKRLLVLVLVLVHLHQYAFHLLPLDHSYLIMVAPIPMTSKS